MDTKFCSQCLIMCQYILVFVAKSKTVPPSLLTAEFEELSKKQRWNMMKTIQN